MRTSIVNALYKKTQQFISSYNSFQQTLPQLRSPQTSIQPSNMATFIPFGSSSVSPSPTPPSPPFQQNLPEYDLEHLKFRAQHSYPDEELSLAMNKVACYDKLEGIFFFDGRGERCVWGKGLLPLAFGLILRN